MNYDETKYKTRNVIDSDTWGKTEGRVSAVVLVMLRFQVRVHLGNQVVTQTRQQLGMRLIGGW